MLKKIIPILFLVLVTAFILLNKDLLALIIKNDFEGIILLLNENLLGLLFVTLLLMIIQNTFTVIPLLLLITINYSLFGFFYGYLWSWFTSIIAAILVFYVVRFCLVELLQTKISAKLKIKVDYNGTLPVFLGRIFPFVPTSLVNIASGIGSVKFKHFLIGTMLGNLIYFFCLSLIPLGFVSLQVEQSILVIVTSFVIILYLVFRIVRKNKINSLNKRENMN